MIAPINTPRNPQRRKALRNFAEQLYAASLQVRQGRSRDPGNDHE
jgi:hypothetical protein